MPKPLPDVDQRASVFRANYARLHGDWRGGGQAGEVADKKINCEGVRKHVTDNKVCVYLKMGLEW